MPAAPWCEWVRRFLAAGSWPPRLSLRVLRCPPRGRISPWGGPAAKPSPPRLSLRVLRCPPRGRISPWGGPAEKPSHPRLSLRVLLCPRVSAVRLGAAWRNHRTHVFVSRDAQLWANRCSRTLPPSRLRSVSVRRLSRCTLRVRGLRHEVALQLINRKGF